MFFVISNETIKTKIMNDDQLEGKWKQIRGEFKQKYGDLTDDDTTYREGKFDEMIGRLQEKTGRTKEQLKQEIDRW